MEPEFLLSSSFLKFFVPLATLIILGVTFLEIRDDKKEGIKFSRIGWVLRGLCCVTIYGVLCALVILGIYTAMAIGASLR